MYTSVNKYKKISFVFHFSKIIMYCIWKQGLEKRGGRSKYMRHL